MKKNISVVITTYNEETHITECIESARLLADTILVLDMHSTDKTRENAQKAGGLVRLINYTKYVEPSREYAIRNAPTDWVYILDADERITPELANTIHNILPSTQNTHFTIPRKNIFGRTRWLKHGGWWPDQQMRLIKKTALQTWPKTIHATPIIKGEKGYIAVPFIHYFHGNIAGMVTKTATYESIEADLLYQADRQVSVLIFFRKYFGELYRRLIQNVGFFDGKIGILEAIYQAYSKTITYLFLYEKKKSRSL